MNLNTKYHGKDITITLTEEQIIEIHKQTKKLKNIEDINGYLDACDILEEKSNSKANYYEQLNTIIRAVNFIDNGYKKWKPKFNGNSYNYYPYFKEDNSGLVFYCSVYSNVCCNGQIAFYLKESSSTYIGKKFISFYQIIRDNY